MTPDELLAECIKEWDFLYEALEQDFETLSDCMDGELLENSLKNTGYLLMQLEEVKKTFQKIIDG